MRLDLASFPGAGPKGAGGLRDFIHTTPAVNRGGTTKGLHVAEEGMTTTPSGLQYRDDVVGDGPEARAGQTVSVHYTGTFPDGRKFDSSRDRGQPFQFPLGGGRVIRGWDEGVAGMKVGGRRTLVIPPDLGYGSRDNGPIPANSVLHFDVELLGVR
jgi:FKBP-type peptidyl-prolyl cis-trans isomerase